MSEPREGATRRASSVSTSALPGAYWRLWSASAISNFGDGVFVIALPLLATRLTNDPISVSLIAAFFTIPWLLFALPVGVILDRVDRRRVLVVADLFRGALVGGLALVAAFSDVQMWMLWVLAFGLGAGEVFFDNCSQTILPSIVPGDQLERANGYFYATEVATNTVIGMPLGSAFFAFAVWLPFGIDAASFVLAAVLAASLRGSFRPSANPSTQSMASDLRGGLRWLLDHSLLRNLALVVTLMNLAFAATQATFVLFAKNVLHVSERSFGPLVAVVGVGSLLAGLVGGKLVEVAGRRAVMLVAGLSPAVTSVVIGLFPRTWLVIAMTTVQAFMTTLLSILAVSLRQQIVPGHLFGRVNSVYRWISTGAMSIGALIGGAMASIFGLRAPYFAAAALLLVATGVIATTLTSAALAAASPRSGILLRPELDNTPVALNRDPLDELL